MEALVAASRRFLIEKPGDKVKARSLQESELGSISPVGGDVAEKKHSDTFEDPYADLRILADGARSKQLINRKPAELEAEARPPSPDYLHGTCAPPAHATGPDPTNVSAGCRYATNNADTRTPT